MILVTQCPYSLYQLDLQIITIFLFQIFLKPNPSIVNIMGVFKTTLIFCIILSVILQHGLSQLLEKNSEKIGISLKEALKRQETVDILVSFRQGTEKALAKVSALSFKSREERVSNVYTTLLVNAKNSQKLTKQILSKEFPKAKTTSFWITNQIHIKNANKAIVNFVSSLDDVSQIMDDPVAYLSYPSQAFDDDSQFLSESKEWGSDTIQASQAWNMAGGNNGTGVVVGVLDTGVRGTHEALRDNYVGDYGWYDTYHMNTVPYDDNGHGTHVTGTIVGKFRLGVAPGAKWSACKAFQSTGSSFASNLLSCAQFFTCPTNGTKTDCSKAPHIVNNSWISKGKDFFNSVIAAWNQAGIIPVFPNGNDGPNCSTVSYPGSEPNVISVGAADAYDLLAEFSSRGPSSDGIMKPDLSAPGVNIRSASHLSDTVTSVKSGTSMASPHVAGVIALLKSQDKSLTFLQVKSLLTNNTDKSTNTRKVYCGGVANSVFPNNHVGHGRVNALKSLQSLVNTSSKNSGIYLMPSLFNSVLFVILSLMLSFVLLK